MTTQIDEELGLQWFSRSDGSICGFPLEGYHSCFVRPIFEIITDFPGMSGPYKHQARGATEDELDYWVENGKFPPEDED